MPTDTLQAQDADSALSPRETITQLIRSIYASNWERYGEIYRAAIVIGDGMVEELSSFLLGEDYRSLEHRLAIVQFGALFNLLHDIDESSALQIGNELTSRGCSPAITSEIHLVTSRLKSDFDRQDISNIEVLFSKDLRFPKMARRKMRKWLGTLPADHLHDLERIHVLPEGGSGDDRIGAYFSTFRRICFDWDEDLHPSNPITWIIGPLLMPQTFLHEIGHHVLGHNGGPRDPRKEKAADQYATIMWFTLHPLVLGFSKLTAKALRLSLRKPSWSERFYSRLNHRRAPLRDGLEEARLEAFEQTNKIAIPQDLKQFLLKTNGMIENSFCESGFHFRGLEEFDVVTTNIRADDGSATAFIVFADHLPGGVRFVLNVDKNNHDFGTVWRSNCRTRSGHLKVAYSFRHFAIQYGKDRALLSC